MFCQLLLPFLTALIRAYNLSRSYWPKLFAALNTGGPVGSVMVADEAVDSKQVFKVEDAGDGQYYLATVEGYYIVCRAWNVDACDNEKTALGFEFVNETDFIMTNANGYFKVENVNGIEYPFCDAKDAAIAATWTLEEYELPEGITSVDAADDAVKGIYDITGRKIENITKPGIYIVNGKKIMVK